LKQHIIRKHTVPILHIGENVQQIGANVQQSGANVQKSGANVQRVGANVQNLDVNVKHNTKPYQCDKCYKNYKNKRYLNIHIDKCTGIINSLQCHICNTVFKNRSTKSMHLKKCTANALIPIVNELSSINNTINNNTLNNSGSITSNSNNTVNNITIISCKPDSNNKELIEFITKHISNPDLQKIIESNGNKCSPEMVESYTRHLLTNPENRCIEKTNMRSIHSKVHVGEGKWHYKHDKELLPYYACSVANNMDQTIKERLANDTNLLDRRTLKAIERYLDYMSDKGYCNNVDLEKDMRQEFHDIKHRLKAIIYEMSTIPE